MGIGLGRAKLLLLGEHAAVHGHLAVGLALPWTLTATHTPGGSWNDSQWGTYARPLRALVEELSLLAVDRGLRPPRPGRLNITSDIVPEGGFGSSAALCAALVGAFFDGLSEAERDELTWRAEFLFHGTPSGIDTALAIRQGWWVLEPRSTAPARARRISDPEISLVAGSVQRSADTKTLVASVSKRLASGDVAVRRCVDDLGAFAREAAVRMERDQPILADLISAARLRLRELGLETPPLTAAIDAGLSCRGSLAGKLSGAGGGGAFFVLFEDSAQAEAALNHVRNSLPDEQWKAPPFVVVP